MPLRNFETDPEFQSFPEELKQQIRDDAAATAAAQGPAPTTPARGPVRQRPEPVPATIDGYPVPPQLQTPTPPPDTGGVSVGDTWAEPITPRVAPLPPGLREQYLAGKARQIPKDYTPAPTLGQDLVEGAKAGLAQTWTGQILQHAADDLENQERIPLTRAIPQPAEQPREYLAPMPRTFSQHVGDAAHAAAETVDSMAGTAKRMASNVAGANLPGLEEDIRDLATFGHGAAAGTAAAVASNVDPAAGVVMAPARGAGNVAQAVVGAQVGAGQSLVNNDLAGAPANIIQNAALAALAPGHKAPEAPGRTIPHGLALTDVAPPTAAEVAARDLAQGVGLHDPAAPALPPAAPAAPVAPPPPVAPAAAPAPTAPGAPRQLGARPHPWEISPDVQALLDHAAAVQKNAPTYMRPARVPVGARAGSVRVGRTPADSWTPAQEAANKALDAKIRELVREAREAEANGNGTRQAQIAREIQALDDGRVVIPRPGLENVTTIHDLNQQAAAAHAAGNTAEANRLLRQAAKMRADRYHNAGKYSFMSQDATDKFHTLMENRVAELWAQGRDPRTPVPFSKVRQQAGEILPFQLEQIARKGLKKGESLTAAEYEAAKNLMQDLVHQSVQVEQHLNAIRAAQHGGPPVMGANGHPINPVDLAAAETIEANRLMQLEKDASGLLEIVTQSRSQKGRDLAYLKMVAQQGWDTGYWLARANRTAGGAATNQNIAAISAIVTRGQTAETAFKAAQAAGDQAAMELHRQEQRQARIDLAKEMGRLTVTPWAEALLAARKAGMLTGTKTMARNAVSNMLNITLEEAVNVIGAVPDAFLGMMNGVHTGRGWRNGRRTTFAREVATIGRAFGEVGERGIREAIETQIHGMPLDQLAALEIPREINTPSRAFNGYVNNILRWQGAQDRVFKAYSLRRSLDSQARSLALEVANGQGPRPTRAQITAHARYLADHPTEQMMMEAVADAEFATFQNETAVSKALAAIQQSLRQWDAKNDFTTGQQLITGLDLFLPFKKTPAAIGARVLDFTAGVGTYQAARQRGRRLRRENRKFQADTETHQQRQAAGLPTQAPTPVEWMTPAEQKAISRGFARQAIGCSLIWLGQSLYRQGRLTGTDQLDRREENAAAGRAGNAIKVGDEWVPLNPFSPVGNMLTLGATMERDGAPGGPAELGQASMQVLALMLDQPFTQGAKAFVEAAGDTGGRKFNRALGGAAGTVVPSLVGEIAQFVDPSEAARAVDNSTPGSSVLQAVQSRVPFWRNMLPTKATGLGDDQGANTGWRAFSAGAGSFARENYDPVVREVLTTGADLPGLEDDIKLPGNPDPAPLNAAQQQRYLRQRGQAARGAVMGQLARQMYHNWEALPDVQRDLLNRAISAASSAARGHYTLEHLHDLQEARDSQTEAQRAQRGRKRAVVGPLSTP